MKCLIVDDDEMSRIALSKLCERFEDLEIAATCESGVKALNLLNKEAFDLLFLDVEMPELSGVELARTAAELPHVIFTTSNPEYAVEAFEIQELVVDYITKPVTFPRLLKAVERARKVLAPKDVSVSDKGYIFVRSDGRLVRIDLEELLYVETVGDYVRFKTADAAHLVHGTLKSIDERLAHPDFLKVHRSFIVNLSKIIDIQDNSVLIDDKVIPVSRAHRNILLKKIDPL